jgi:choline monooxygenase
MAVQPTRAHDEVLRFDPEVPIERAWQPPASWYTDPDIYALERPAVFGRSWQAVARLDQLAQPGAFVSGCIAGIPWVVVRAEDGGLRAFHNVCRHKGREVVRGSGTASELVCGYHAWVYDLEGRLRRAPRIAGIEAFEREEMALPSLRVETWGAWVFVNADPQAAPLAEGLTELARRLGDRSLGKYRYIESTEWIIACNWKAVIDNYLDGGYHIPHMHPTLDAQLDMESYRTENFGMCCIQSSAPSALRDERIGFDARDRIGQGAIYAWIHPNFMINLYGPCIDTNTVVPLGPDRCKVVYDFFVHEDAGDAGTDFVRRSIEQSAVTQREDIEICESIQVGMQSPSFDRGRYAPRVEHGEHHFHVLLARQLRRALG